VLGSNIQLIGEAIMSSDVTNGKPVLVNSGDTLAAICAKIYGIQGSQTKKYWGEFYRKERGSGKLVPLTNPNLIYAGETLYHRPGIASGGSETSAVSDGVINANPKEPSKNEMDLLKKDMKEVRNLIDKVIELLKKPDRMKGSVRDLFLEANAYADLKHGYIVVHRQTYFVECKDNQPKRVHTLIHELSHIAFKAADLADPGINSGSKIADFYADFAVPPR